MTTTLPNSRYRGEEIVSLLVSASYRLPQHTNLTAATSAAPDLSLRRLRERLAHSCMCRRRVSRS